MAGEAENQPHGQGYMCANAHLADGFRVRASFGRGFRAPDLGQLDYFPQYPKRCRMARESFDPDQPIRVLNYGRSPHAYRVFFTVDENANVVRIVHIRRGARQRPTSGELKGE